MAKKASNSIKLSDLIPDDKNANKGTERGRGFLEKSLRELGAGRSILIDKNGKVIAGNKTTEIASEIGLDDVIVVKTDGRQIVAVQRTDLDLDNDDIARKLATADNRVGQIDLEWDLEELQKIYDTNPEELTEWFRYNELQELGVDLQLSKQELSPYDEWVGMPEFEQEEQKPWKEVTVRFLTEDDYWAFAKLVEQNLSEKTISMWYPKHDFDQTNREYVYSLDEIVEQETGNE